MKPIKFILFVFLGLILVLLDVSFFSFITVMGASIITSFLVLIMMAITDRKKDFAYFSLLLVLYFSIFSSLPLFLIGLNILILPLAMNFVMKKYFRSPNVYASSIYFFIASFVFEFSFLVWVGEWNLNGYMAVLSFVLINTMAGFLLNFLYHKAQNRLLADFEIKI